MGLEEQMQRLRESLGELPPRPAGQPPTVDEVMARVRAEVARRRGQPQADALSAAGHAAPAVLPRWAPARGRLAYRSDYRLDELLAFSDLDFIDQCYRIVLRRPPDDGGLNHYLGLLRSGALSKVEILGEIRFSPEGMQRGVHVDGLLLPYTLWRWSRKPVLGPVLRWFHGLLHLGAFHPRQDQLDGARARDLTDAGQTINRLSERLEGELARLASEHRSESEHMAQRAAKAEEATRSLEAQLVDASTRLAALEARLELSERHRAEHVQHLQHREAALRQEIDALQAALRSEAASQQQAMSARADALGEQTGALVHELKRSNAEWSEQAMRLRGEATTQQQAAQARSDALGQKLAALQQELKQELKRSEAAWREQATQLRGEASTQQQAAQARSGALEQKLAALQQELKQELKRSEAAWREQATQLRGEAVTQQQTLVSRADTLDETVAAILARQHAEDEVEAKALGEYDALYADFEEHFRGSRELIIERARRYLDWVREAGAGSEEAPVLDLGCGRGEWLELLRDEQLHGSGIDLNRIFVEACRGRGLVVEHADVLQALKALPPKSIGAITSMHLVEHLPFEVLMALLDETRRVLRPGGLLLLETPNPENLIVGSCTFYTDPTHRNPIPPDTLRWLVESQGFQQVQIVRLRQNRGVSLPDRVSDDQPGAATLNAVAERFAEAPDYAIRAISP